MELLHWGPLAQVITKGGTTVNQEIMPAYAAYQKAIDLTLYHAFAELVVQTSQDDKARMHYRQIEAAQIWQQDVDVSIYFEQYKQIKSMLYLNCFYGYRTFPGSKTTCKIDLWTEKSAKNRGRLRVPIKKKTEDVFTHPPFLLLAV